MIFATEMECQGANPKAQSAEKLETSALEWHNITIKDVFPRTVRDALVAVQLR